jgi:endonuclease/exonuclease/phosphatase family metal-dependent hydrolase
MTQTLSIATWNIHKGFSQFNRRMMVHELRERLRELSADIVFLQEVQGLHLGHAERHADWPSQPQHEFLAEDVWDNHAYGRNMVYDHGHHGNAILSRFPILTEHNQDVTHLRFEKRGLLHCAVELPALAQPLHCVCVHLSLFARSRRRQMDALARRIEEVVPAHAPLLIAGDFNDWRNHADDQLAERLGLVESLRRGRPAAIAQLSRRPAAVPPRPHLPARPGGRRGARACRPALVLDFRPRGAERRAAARSRRAVSADFPQPLPRGYVGGNRCACCVRASNIFRR